MVDVQTDKPFSKWLIRGQRYWYTCYSNQTTYFVLFYWVLGGSALPWRTWGSEWWDQFKCISPLIRHGARLCWYTFLHSTLSLSSKIIPGLWQCLTSDLLVLLLFSLLFNVPFSLSPHFSSKNFICTLLLALGKHLVVNVEIEVSILMVVSCSFSKNYSSWIISRQ